jgi:glutathione S-transferase
MVDRVGPLVRQYVYSATLTEPGSGVKETLLEGLPPWQKWVGSVMWPVTRRLMALGMQAAPALNHMLAARLDAELASLDAEIGDRDTLVGETFGRADLTVASLLSPLFSPPVSPRYVKIVMPEAVRATLAGWRTRPSLRFAAETYRSSRAPRVTDGSRT